MRTIHLNCNNCGSPMEINKKIKYLSCLSCGSSLMLKENGNVIYTELVNKNEIGIKPKKLDDAQVIEKKEDKKAKKLLIEAKIARLDRDWKEEEKQHRFLLGDVYYLPEETEPKDTFIAVASTIFVSYILYRGIIHPWNLITIGFLLVFMFLYHIIHTNRQEKYEAAKKRYMDRRRSLLARLK